jgi:hypothetical protein
VYNKKRESSPFAPDVPKRRLGCWGLGGVRKAKGKKRKKIRIKKNDKREKKSA